MARRKGIHSSERLKQIVKTATDQAWTVELTNGGHVKFTAPNGDMIFTGSSPGVTAHRNLRAQLRKAGLDC